MNDLFSIAGKVAFVTGGSRGIGLMIARGFVEAGAKVYISSRKRDVCEQAAAELSTAGTCISLPADISTEAGAKAVAEELARREPALHILVNNAGANWGAPLDEYPDSAWDKVLALNVKAPFLLTRALMPLLEKAARPGDPARVINIGSIDGLQAPMLETYAYSASKAAVHHLTRVLARTLAPQGHHRQCRRARPVREQDDGRDARTLQRRHRRDLSARPHRRARGHGRRGDLPRVARRRVPDRRGHSGGRRHLDLRVRPLPSASEYRTVRGTVAAWPSRARRTWFGWTWK